MAIEIERKFLVRNDQWQAQIQSQSRICQGYFGQNATNASIRVRISGDKANINIKSAHLGIRRSEYEYPIPLSDARQMLACLCDKPLVEKTRYRILHQAHCWEVDVFEGDNAGLIVAEIELSEENEAFCKPQWLGKEVSDDPRYYNVCLVQNPYKDWLD